MANDSPEDVVASARSAGYAGSCAPLAGNGPVMETMFDTILEALETWPQDYRGIFTLTAATSMRGGRKTELSPAERRDLAFRIPRRATVPRCHIATRVMARRHNFTDYGLLRWGASESSHSRHLNPDVVRLGMCGPLRTDLRWKG